MSRTRKRPQYYDEGDNPGNGGRAPERLWSGSPDPTDPDNWWIDDETGERVCAKTGERFAPDVSKATKHAYGTS